MNTEDIYDMRYAYDITQDIFPTTSYADDGSEEIVVERKDYRVYLDEVRGITLNSPARHIKPQYTASFSASLDKYLDDYVLKWLKEFNWEYQPIFVAEGQTLATVEFINLTDCDEKDRTSSYETGELDTFIDSFKIIEEDNT